MVFPYKDFGQGSAGHSPYLTVNKVDLSIKNAYGGTRYPYAACPIPNTDEVKSLYYFPASGSDKTTTAPTLWNYGTGGNGTDGNPLFAHTFKLAAGSYFISTNVPGMQLPISYVAVEGQSGGRLGSTVNYTISADKLENVDFLVSSPSAATVVAYVEADRSKWYASHRTWCISSLEFSASSTSLIYKAINLTIDDETTTCFAISFAKDGGLESIEVTNYGGSSSLTNYTQKYVVFCNSSWSPYDDPSLNSIVSWNKS